MKRLKLLAALLALTIGLAGCGGAAQGGRPARILRRVVQGRQPGQFCIQK